MSLLWKTAVKAAQPAVEQFPVEKLKKAWAGDYSDSTMEQLAHPDAYPWDAWDERGADHLSKTMESVRQHGVQKPLQITKLPDGEGAEHEIQDGHHRGVAAIRLGHSHVPAIVHHPEFDRQGNVTYPTMDWPE